MIKDKSFSFTGWLQFSAWKIILGMSLIILAMYM
jgi:hypothetical protein